MRRVARAEKKINQKTQKRMNDNNIIIVDYIILLIVSYSPF